MPYYVYVIKVVFVYEPHPLTHSHTHPLTHTFTHTHTHSLTLTLTHRAEQLVSEIHGQSGVPAESQVVFSTTSDLYLSPHTSMTPQQFSDFVEKAGGPQGHVVVYLLPSKNLVELVEPDYSCLAKLSMSIP